MSGRLSKREREVLGCLLYGLSIKEIGQALSISPRTVQKHIQRVDLHLGVQTRAERTISNVGTRGVGAHDSARTARQQAAPVVSGRHDDKMQQSSAGGSI